MFTCEELFYFSFIAIISLLSKIPFISINMLLPFPEWTVWCCVIANIISWFLLEVWALGLDASFFLREAKINTISGFFLAIAVISLAIISQIPNVFPAIQYNPKEYSPYIAICVLIALSFFPIKSLILTCRMIYRYFYVSLEERIFDSKVEQLRNEYMNLPKEQKMKIEFDYITNSENIDSQLDLFNLYNSIHKKWYLCCINGRINIGTILGLFTVICYEWFNAEYSFSKWNEFVSNDGISAYILSILVVITTFYLTGISVISMFTSLFNPKLNYEYETFKIRYYIVQFLIFISSILSVGVYLVVVPNFYTNNEIKKYLFTICCCLTIFMILETGSYAMVNYFFKFLISYYGTVNDKTLIEINDKIFNLKITNKCKVSGIVTNCTSTQCRIRESSIYSDNLELGYIEMSGTPNDDTIMV